jgi:hypothetical protein
MSLKKKATFPYEINLGLLKARRSRDDRLTNSNKEMNRRFNLMMFSFVYKYNYCSVGQATANKPNLYCPSILFAIVPSPHSKGVQTFRFVDKMQNILNARILHLITEFSGENHDHSTIFKMRFCLHRRPLMLLKIKPESQFCLRNSLHSFHRIISQDNVMRRLNADVFTTDGTKLGSVILHSNSPVKKNEPTSPSRVQLLSNTTVDDMEEGLSCSDKSPRKSSPLDVRLRRLRANDRERRRIQSINGAMEALRRVIPNTKDDRKVTKLQLLKLAQDYIRYLSGILTTSNNSPTSIQGSAYGTSSVPQRDLDSFNFNPTCDFVQSDVCFAQ